MRIAGMRKVLPFLVLVGAIAGAAYLLSPPPRGEPPPPSPPPAPRVLEPRRTHRPPAPMPAPLPAALGGRVLGTGVGPGAWVALTGLPRELRVPLAASGAYEFPEVPSGRELALWLGPDTDGARLVKLASGIVLVPGENRRFDVTASARPALEGVVGDEKGLPLAGARVAVLDPAADWREEVPVAAITGADGLFHVGFAAGQTSAPLRLVVDAVGQGFVIEERIVTPDPDGGTVSVSIRLSKGLPIGGRVLDPEGKPVPGAEVHILEDDPGDIMERRPIEGLVRTDAEGRFRDEAYRPGVYRACVDGALSDRRIAAVKEGVLAGDEAVEIRLRGFGRLELAFEDAAARAPLVLDGGSLEFVYGHTGEEEEYAEWADLGNLSSVDCENLPEGHYRVTAWAIDHEDLFSDLIYVEAGKDLGLIRFGLTPVPPK